MAGILALGGCASGGSFVSELGFAPEPPGLYGSYLAGRHASAVRDAEAAARYYKHALDRDPDNPVILERSFLLQIADGKIDRALPLARGIVEREGANPYARLLLAVDALDRGAHAEARAHLAEADSGPFAGLASGLLVAWSYLGEGRPADAFAELELLDSSEAFRVFQKFHEALIADLAEEGPRARAAFAESMKLNGGRSLRLVQAYGSFLERRGEVDAARKLYEGYLLHAPNNALIAREWEEAGQGKRDRAVRTAQEGVAEALYGFASIFPRESNLELPLIYLQLALATRPDFPVAQMLLGERWESAGRWERAVEAFSRVDEESGLGQSAAIQIAFNLDRLDKTDEAVSRLRREVRKDPEFFLGLMTIADILRSRERYGEAVTAYDEALALVPEVEERHWTLFYARGTTLERLKRWPEAEASLQKALELRPDEPLILNYLGYSWVEMGLNLDEALGMIRRAVELRPNDGFIVDSLGWAHYRLGDYERAVRLLERAAALSPGISTINDHLGDAYWRVGRKIEARFQWQHALDIDPEEDDIPKIRRKIDFGLPDLPDPVTPAEPAS